MYSLWNWLKINDHFSQAITSQEQLEVIEIIHCVQDLDITIKKVKLIPLKQQLKQLLAR